MLNLQISEIQIFPINPKDGLVGFASCVINESVFLGSIAIYTSLSKLGEYRLVFPSKKMLSGKEINVFYPIHREAGEWLSKAIIGKFKDLMIKEEE